MRSVLSKLSLVLGLTLVAAVLPARLLAQQSTVPPPQPTVTPLPTDAPPPAGPISTVNGEAILAADYQDRVRLTRFLYAYNIRETIRALMEQGIDAQRAASAVQSFYAEELEMLQVGDLLGARVLDAMEDEALLRTLARDQGITISDADSDAQVETYLGQAEAVTNLDNVEATPEPTEESFQSTISPAEAFFNEAEQRAGISREAARAYFEGQALRARFTDEVAGPFPTEWPYATVRHILVRSEDEANDVLARLNAGEDFAAVAADVSIDSGSSEQGGELGTVVAETFVEPVASAVRDAEVGRLVGPVESQFGFHVIEVTTRETQPLEAQGERALRRLRSREFLEWLDEQMAQAQIDRIPNWADLIPRQPNGVTLLQAMMTGLQ